MEAKAEVQRQAKLRADAEWRKQQRERDLERLQVRVIRVSRLPRL